ncbi:MAG: FAD:protein FMN transferase [Oceanicoccus sp.]
MKISCWMSSNGLMIRLTKNSQRAAQLLFLVVLSVVLIACDDAKDDYFVLTGQTMGTSYHITVVKSGNVASAQNELQQAIDQQLSVLNQQMSTYIDDSELTLLNRALVNEWVPVSSNLFDVLVLSMELGWISGGAFDITVGPLVNLWGFGPGNNTLNNTIPADNIIQQLLDNTGFSNIELNLENTSVRKNKAVAIDLSGVAKGYAVDKIAELLQYAGYSRFMVEIGGEVRLKGHSPRRGPWRIAIEQPDATSFGSPRQAISITDGALATSGDYRSFFDVDGKRYSHTIDPSTGYPIDHSLASVTVIADTSAYADALATALTVMGPEKGLQMATEQGIAVYMIIKTGDGFVDKYSDAFGSYLDL